MNNNEFDCMNLICVSIKSLNHLCRLFLIWGTNSFKELGKLKQKYESLRGIY